MKTKAPSAKGVYQMLTRWAERVLSYKTCNAGADGRDDMRQIVYGKLHKIDEYEVEVTLTLEDGTRIRVNFTNMGKEK